MVPTLLHLALITIRRRDCHYSYSMSEASIIFQMLFCVGNFFGDDNKEWDALKTGEIKGEKCSNYPIILKRNN